MKAALLVFLLGAVAALPVEDLNPNIKNINAILQSTAAGERNTSLENLVLNLLESVRELMREGSESIPVLDPLRIPDIDVEGNLLPILDQSHLKVNGLSINQLSAFDVDLSIVQPIIILPRYRVDLVGSIPVIEVQSETYDIFLSVLGFRVFGSGKIDVKILEPTLKVDMEVGVRISLQGLFLEIRSADIKFTLDRCEFAITGLFDDVGSSDFVNAFLRILISDLLDEYQVEIDNFLTTTVYEVGNEILADLNLVDIITPFI